jgi:hypothetical protein
MTTAYPLAWPTGRPRTQGYYRKDGNFKKDGAAITIRAAMERLQSEIEKLGGKDAVLSANLQRNLDGSPRSGQPEPADPGVAVYFTLKGKPICMPCDTYRRAAQNIAAIAAHIDATRAIERYGVATVAEMFRGFEALPAPKGWREILGIQHNGPVDRAAVEALYRNRARERHPDMPGGSTAAMAELNAARDEALREVG